MFSLKFVRVIFRSCRRRSRLARRLQRLYAQSAAKSGLVLSYRRELELRFRSSQALAAVARSSSKNEQQLNRIHSRDLLTMRDAGHRYRSFIGTSLQSRMPGIPILPNKEGHHEAIRNLPRKCRELRASCRERRQRTTFHRYKRMEAAWRALADEQDWLDGEVSPARIRRPRRQRACAEETGRADPPHESRDEELSNIPRATSSKCTMVGLANLSRRCRSDTDTGCRRPNLRLFEINDEIASQALINADDGTRVRVRPLGERSPEARTQKILKQG